MKKPKPHPMGEPIPGQWFVFAKKTVEIKYHSLIGQGTEEEVAAAALESVDHGEVSARTMRTISTETVVRPVREGHVQDKSRDDFLYLRAKRAQEENEDTQI